MTRRCSAQRPARHRYITSHHNEIQERHDEQHTKSRAQPEHLRHAIEPAVFELWIDYPAQRYRIAQSLIGSPAIMAFYDLEPEERLAIGIKDNLLRYSTGIKDAGDLIADLEQALAQLD